MDIYSLYRDFWDFSFDNPEKIKPNHIAIFSFAIEHCNRLGWKNKFGFPTSMAMDAVGIKSYSVFKKHLDQLVEFGFIEIIEYSKNQYSSNIIALKENYKANSKSHSKSLDKAIGKHTSKQVQSTSESIGSINKPLNKEKGKPRNQETKKLLLSEIDISDVEDGLKQYFEIAVAFQKLFIKNLEEKNSPTKNQTGAKFLSYVEPIRLMFENDGVKLEQVQSVFKYLNSPQGEFWKSNILSTKKLREKFPQLVLKSKETLNGNRNNSNKYANSASVQGTFDEIDKMFGRK
jgi:hypothetical protein